MVPLSEKYLNLPPSPPWPSVTATSSPTTSLAGMRFCSANMADIDNDGRDEIVALCPGQFSEALGVLSYFNYTEMTPAWESMVPQTLMVSAAVVSGNQTNWTASLTDRIWNASIRDNQGVDLLVFDQNQTLSLVRWEQAAINGNPATFVLNNYWSATGTISGASGQPNWTLGSNDTFHVGDLDGDGIAEILVFDGNKTLAVLKWTDAELQLVWNSSNGAIPSASSGAPWLLFPADSYTIGHITGDNQAEILVFDGNSWLGILRWESGGLWLYWVTENAVSLGASGATWNLGSDNWFHLADINGDGQQEIVATNATTLGAIGWDGSNLTVLGVNNQTISGSGGQWTIGANDVHYLADFEQTKHAGVLVFGGGQIGLLSWDGASHSFTADFIASSVSTTDNLAWNFGSDNLFTCADVDGDGIAEIMVQSDSGGALALLKWSNGQLLLLWAYTRDAPGPLPTWGVALITGAPSSQFADFTGTLGEIYASISQTICGYGVSDIRSKYITSTEEFSFAAWGTALLDADANEPAWSWMNKYSLTDFETVSNQLQSELAGVASAYALNYNFNDFLSQLADQRKADLNTVVTNLTVTIPPESKVEYWVGQIFVAALWGIAAVSIEGIPAFSITGAMIASLAGSLLGDTNTSNPPGQVEYQDLSAAIGNEYKTATNASNAQLQAVTQDPVKLLMLGQLLITQWQWTPTTTATVVAASSDYTRLYYYQQLAPSVYQIIQEFQTTNGSICLNPPPPPWAVWSYITEMKFNNISMMSAQGTGTPSEPIIAYPSLDLAIDLFTNLNIDKQAFFTGQSSIALPFTQTPVIGDGAPGATIFTTNSTSQAVWITIYDLGKTKHMDFGWLQPGTTVIWVGQHGQYQWGEYYYVRGQVQTGESLQDVNLSDPNSTSPPLADTAAPEHNTPTDTTVKVSPTWHEFGHNSYSGYALNIVGNGSYYWEHVN